MHKLTTLLIIVLAALSVSAYTPSCQGNDYSKIIATESAYIASCQLPSGAIVMGLEEIAIFQGSDHYKICPYFSNFAAEALLENPTSTNVAIVKKWLQWYFNRLNPNGSIYDYYADNFTNDVELPATDAYSFENIPKYDSVDSYAATFLSLCRKYAQVTGDTAFLKSNSAGINLVGSALESVIDEPGHNFGPVNNDGLTVAEREYQDKYTMDNSEVNKGLTDMVWLQQNVTATNNSAHYATLLANNTKGINANLWNSENSDYFVDEGGKATDWRTFYPDATCQLYPAIFGVTVSDPNRALNLYNTFNSYYPAWFIGTVYDPGGYPWAIVVYAAVMLGDLFRPLYYLNYVQHYEPGHPAHWYIMEAAFTLMAANKLLQLGD